MINLDVILTFESLYKAIDFMLLQFFWSKSIMVLICLFLKASCNFVSMLAAGFLFLHCLLFFWSASSESSSFLFWFSKAAILAFLNGSSYFTCVSSCQKVCSISCCNKSLFTKAEIFESKSLYFLIFDVGDLNYFIDDRYKLNIV